MKINNNRFLFPDEWRSFTKDIKKDKKIRYELQFFTGSRFDELVHLRPRDFDFERNNVVLWKTKTKAKKGQKTGKPRVISLPSKFSKRLKNYLKDFHPEEYAFKVSQAGYNQFLKYHLKKIGVEASEEFSSHNIRKTHGMYLKAMGVDIAEICTRLGHDYNTYIQHYGSPSIFTESDMREIKLLLDDLVDRLRRRF